MLREIAPSAKDNTEYEFTIEAGNTLAVISFTTPTDTTLQNLTLGIFGDLGVSDITGLDKGQIKSAFRKAAKGFQAPTTHQLINLIVAESLNPRKNAIDFCEALYGTEFFTAKGWSRYSDGLFSHIPFSQNTGGVIAIFRNSGELTSTYSKALCVNPEHVSLIEPISKLIKTDRVIYPSTYIEDGFLEKSD
jgi:hypothetical protein